MIISFILSCRSWDEFAQYNIMDLAARVLTASLTVMEFIYLFIKALQQWIKPVHIINVIGSWPSWV